MWHYIQTSVRCGSKFDWVPVLWLCCGWWVVVLVLEVTGLTAPPEDGTEVLNHVGGSNLMSAFLLIHCILLVSKDIQGGSNMTGTNCDLFTHKQSRSYLNHLVSKKCKVWTNLRKLENVFTCTVSQTKYLQQPVYNPALSQSDSHVFQGWSKILADTDWTL